MPLGRLAGWSSRLLSTRASCLNPAHEPPPLFPDAPPELRPPSPPPRNAHCSLETPEGFRVCFSWVQLSLPAFAALSPLLAHVQGPR